jgi:hypothetical protein
MTANDSILERANSYISGTFSLIAPIISHKPLSLDFNHNKRNSLTKHIVVAIRPHLPNTMGFSEPLLYDTYANFVERYGSKDARDALRDGKQVIIGLRIETNTRANQGQGLYDDRLAIIWQETQHRVQHGCLPSHLQRQQIVKHGVDFAANTEPSAHYEQPTTHIKQIMSKKTGKMIQVKVADKIIDPEGKDVIPNKEHKWYGEDVNKDGRLDLGRLVPGTYKFYLGAKYHGYYALRPRGQETVVRDINHDGVFTKDDIWHTDQGDTVIEIGSGEKIGIIFHRGGINMTGSAGCQTLSPIEHVLFFKTLKKQTEYFYVLVTIK